MALFHVSAHAGPACVSHHGEVGEEQEIHQTALGDFRAAKVMANVMISVDLGFRQTPCGIMVAKIGD
jgi:hypothetical protein